MINLQFEFVNMLKEFGYKFVIRNILTQDGDIAYW